MEITYIGHSCFKLKGKNATVVIDPYDPSMVGYKLPKLEADILISSHDHPDHNYTQGVNGSKLTITGPGEYDVLDTFVMGISAFHDDKEGTDRGRTTLFLIEMEGLNILHLGDLGHELSTEILEKLPEIHVLLIPVGGVYTINGKTAAKIISTIEPFLVVPMHYQTADLKLSEKLDELDKFLDEMGLAKNTATEDKLKITAKGDLPEETRVVVLSPQH